ncbi:MAG TPA: GAF domain-containing protein, partial [Vicinamibacterales bacterium]
AEISAVTRTSNAAAPTIAHHRSSYVISHEPMAAMCQDVHASIPSALTVFFAYDCQTTELVATHTEGDIIDQLIGFRIALGQRISGWVAANRESILNSDATLDLSELIVDSPHRLRSCLSVPVIAGDQLLGVITCYGSEPDVFTKSHQRLVADATSRRASVTPLVTH